MSTEVILRFIAVFSISLLMIAFGAYFALPERFDHDLIFWGAGVITLLSGLATFVGATGMLFRQVREWGPDGLLSDAGVVDEAPAEAKNAKPSVADTTD
jgi:hypothetical protein